MLQKIFKAVKRSIKIMKLFKVNNMKKFYACIIYLVVIANVFAQAPQKMSYQAVIRNNNKVLITNRKVSMIISILQNKTPIYVELHNPITNDNGLVSLEVGNGVVLIGTFAGIDWSKGSHYIKTETDPTGGSDYSIVGESELLSVPYALYAGNTSSSGGTQGAMGPAGPAGPMGPAGPSGSAGIGGKTNLAKLMSGDVTMDSLGVSTISKNAVSSLEIADGSIGNADLDKSNISLSGFGVPTANISMGGFKLTNIATPTSNKDAATKKYVDDALLAGASPVMSLDANQNLSIKGGNSVSLVDLYQSLSLAGTVLSISGPRDSHVDLAGMLVGLGGSSGSGSSVVSHDGTLTGTGLAATPLGVSNQGITPLKLAGINANGTSGQVLTTNGSGSFAWADPASGSVSGLTAVTASQGLSTTTPTPGIVNVGVMDGALALSKLAPIASGTILGNNTASLNYPATLSATTLKSMLVLTKSDVGLANVKDVDQTNAINLTSGAIPAGRFASATIPVSAIVGNGNAATFLRGDGTWGTPVVGSSVASGISTTAIPGVSGTNVQTTLEGLKTLIDVNSTGLATKLTGNIAITGNTKTKITYDSKGLVTAGADATTADIASTLDKRYVTDAQLASLGSLSGTNTGDQSATTVPVTPTGSLVSTNVQAALVELQGKITTAASGGMVGVNHDATLSGDGNSSNLTIADGGVSLAKMSNLTAKTLIGNSSPFAAKPEAITIGSGLTLSSGVLSAGGATAGATGGDVVLTGQNYLSLSGQTITANPIDLSGTNATGTLAAARFPALTGDVTTIAGSLVTTLTSTGITPGTYTSVNVDAKGRIISGVNNTTLGAGLTDVDVSTKAPGEVLQWDGSKWVNKPASTGNQSITFTATGDVTGTTTGTTSLTPTLTIGTGKVTNAMLATGIDAAKLTGTLPLSTIPTTLTGITSINGMSISTIPTFSLSDGTKTLTVAGNTAVSGTNTGDQTAATLNLNPAISGITGTTVQGALTDIAGKLTQNTTDIAKKLDANSGITASSSFSLVNYDAKGLVTGGKIPTTDDISDAASATHKYVTPAQLIILGNTTGTNTGDQILSVTAAGKLNISGATGNSVDVVTSLIAGSGLTGTGTTGDVTLSLGTNAVGASSLKGSSGALSNGGGNGFVLQSNGDGTFSWKDITSGVAADPSSLALGTGQFYIGDASSKASAISKSAIPLSGFGVPTADVSLGSKKIISLADPSDPQDAATKNYVDTHMPASLVGAVVYKGPYNATTGTPALGTADASNLGHYYVVTDAGYNPVALNVGDWMISDGTNWSKVANSNVAYTTDQVPETATPTNKYYTETRVNANPSVVALGINKEDKSNKGTAIVSEPTNTAYPSIQAVKNYVDTRVPAYSSSNNGQVLSVVGGNPTWQTITGGGTVKTISVVDNSNGITGAVSVDPVNPAITLTLGTIKPLAITTTGAISGGAITGTSVIATGIVNGSNITNTATVSGANTGDQTITLTGPVTGSGKGTFATTISDNAITSAKIADKAVSFSDIADATITPAQMNIAGTASVGSVPAYNASGGFTWGTGGATNLSNVPSATDVLVKSSSGSSTTIYAATTTDAGVMLASDKVKLNGAITSVTIADGLSASTTSGAVSLGINTAGIALGKLATMADKTILGNNSGSIASPSALSVATLQSMLSLNLKQDVSNLTNDANFAADATNSSVNDIRYPSVKAIKNYVDTKTAAAGGGDMLLAGTQSVTGTKTFNNSTLAMKAIGANAGVTTISTLNASSTNYTISLPAETGTVAMRSSSLSQFATTTSALLAGIISDETGTGASVFANAPTFTAATGAAPFTVNSTTPVASLSIGGNAATATTATTAATATNSAITRNSSGGPVYPTWVTNDANTNQALNVTTALSFMPSTGTLSTTKFSGDGSLLTNLNATNLTSGTILAGRYGTSTIPIAALNYPGGASASLFLAGDGTWKAAGGAGATDLTYTQAALQGTVNSNTGADAVIPEATTSYAGLLNNTDKTKLTNIPTISGGATANGQVLTYDGSVANWALPGLQYSGTTGAGKVSVINGSTTQTANIPVASTTLSGLMVPADKTKLDKLPTVTNAPVATADQVLTSNADGTATWKAATGGSGGGSSTIYKAVAQDGTTPVVNVLVKGSGPKIKFWIETASTNIFHVSIPSGAVVDYIRIYTIRANMSLQGGFYYCYIDVKDESGNTNNSYIDALMPNFNYVILNRLNATEAPWSTTTVPLAGTNVENCSAGTLHINVALGTGELPLESDGGTYIILSY